MTENERKTAVISALKDRVENGNAAKPAGYWGVAPIEKGHELDALMDSLSPDALYSFFILFSEWVES